MCKHDGADLINNGGFVSAGGHGKWQMSGRAWCVQGPHWFIGPRWWLAYELIQIAKSCPLGTLCWTGPGFGNGDREESHLTCPVGNPNRCLQLELSWGADWRVRYLPVIPQLCQASRMGLHNPCVAPVHEISLHCGWAGDEEKSTSKRNLQWRADFQS